jgi:hypothetical protein
LIDRTDFLAAPVFHRMHRCSHCIHTFTQITINLFDCLQVDLLIQPRIGLDISYTEIISELIWSVYVKVQDLFELIPKTPLTVQ